MTRQLTVKHSKWPLKKPFVISRSHRIETETIEVSISEGDFHGVGGCVPNARYHETIASTHTLLLSVCSDIEKGMDRDRLRAALPAGAARNALDCALWDLEAKLSAMDVGQLTGLGWPQQLRSVQTISMLSPEEMHNEALELANFPVIKIKLNDQQILARVEAVAAGAPNSKILIDANESWSFEILEELWPLLAAMNVVMIEQPLKAGRDQKLQNYAGSVPVFADESCHTIEDVPALAGKYQGINIKLDKTGGLTEALKMCDAAKIHDLEIMIGCMLSTSLGIAPAMFLASAATYVDIDAPILLAKDRRHGIKIDNGEVSILDPRLWGGVQCSTYI